MTTTAQPVPDATTPGSPAIAGGVFTRLNPADGLFLRAEHLDRMERYAADLAAAVGAGLGRGVVFGFTCTLSDDKKAVHATGGLAFAAGQPLRSSQMTTVSLENLDSGVGDFWVVEIVPATWLYGSEPVYGGLCEDPCGRGSGIAPYAAEGVKLQLRNDSLTEFGHLGEKPKEFRRNWLASKYFEREREYGGAVSRSANAPWLMPEVPSDHVQNITRRPWSDGTGHHDHMAVPLAVVWKDDDAWQLDVWTARRDLGDPTPVAAWQWRLGWRPRSVFMAQVLQFQAQLAHGWPMPARKQPEHIKRALEHLGSVTEQVSLIRSAKVEPAVASLEMVRQSLEGQELSSLIEAGFEELPPAGYLPLGFDNVEDAEYAAPGIFGEGVDVRVICCRADYVAHAVEEAQHMDRIPLCDWADHPPKIDLLVPLELTDLDATFTRSYGWSAFVRRREEVHEERRDRVQIWTAELQQTTHDIISAVVDALAGKANGVKVQYRWTVSYPPDEWAVPTLEDGPTWAEVGTDLSKLSEEIVIVAVVGVAHSAEREPLAAARASLLVTPQSAVGLQVPTTNPLKLPPTYVVSSTSLPEATVLLFGQQ